MMQHRETNHTVQTRTNINGVTEKWHKPNHPAFHPAQVLAKQGRLIEAIEAAERIELETFGTSGEQEFRVVTEQFTITMKR
ncbi:hypothetical protein SH449x_004095 [Pirellulaceae bacterium SH449]